jgi:uncharacterized protein with GYD domain
MPSYLSLISWTEQGVKNFRETTKRAQSFAELVERSGGRVHDFRWTVGEYDMFIVTEFPDDQAAAAALLQVAALGNVRSKTLRAFDSAEMDAIIGRAT